MLLTKLWMEVMEDTEAKLQMSLKACIMSIYHPHTHTHTRAVYRCACCVSLAVTVLIRGEN